jgi:hypothetical protein
MRNSELFQVPTFMDASEELSVVQFGLAVVAMEAFPEEFRRTA